MPTLEYYTLGFGDKLKNKMAYNPKNKLAVKWYEDVCLKKERNNYHELWVGFICIGVVIKVRGKEDYLTRLQFTQERGNVDFSKDKHFATLDEGISYINKEFARYIKLLHFSIRRGLLDKITKNIKTKTENI